MDDTKFWLSPEGHRYGREPMEENHEDIGRRILRQLGVRYDHRANDGVYTALFKINYVRGVEYAEMRSIYVYYRVSTKQQGLDGRHGMSAQRETVRRFVEGQKGILEKEFS